MDAIHRAGGAVRLPPFEVVFDYAMSFDRRKPDRPFVLRTGVSVTGLTRLQRVLGQAMREAGLRKLVSMNFTPHMTLLYDKRLVPELPIEHLSWTVRDFVLIHSLIGCGKHVHLARWPLRG
jgi:RNA 2',3'-cyclic 3'-phosphodiesterase